MLDDTAHKVGELSSFFARPRLSLASTASESSTPSQEANGRKSLQEMDTE